MKTHGEISKVIKPKFNMTLEIEVEASDESQAALYVLSQISGASCLEFKGLYNHGEVESG